MGYWWILDHVSFVFDNWSCDPKVSPVQPVEVSDAVDAKLQLLSSRSKRKWIDLLTRQRVQPIEASFAVSPLCHMPGVPDVWVFAVDARTTPEFGISCFTRRPVYILHVALQKKKRSRCCRNYFADALNQEHPRTSQIGERYLLFDHRFLQYHQRLEVWYRVFAQSESIVIPLTYITGPHHADITWQSCHPYGFGFVWE